MPFSSRVGKITATVLWAPEPVDSHIRVHTWREKRYSDKHTCTHKHIHRPKLWQTALPYWVFSVLGLQPSSQTPKQKIFLLCNNVHFIFFVMHQWTNSNLCATSMKETLISDHFLPTLMSSRTLNRVSHISARWSIRSSAWRPRIRSFKARQLKEKFT